MTNHNAEVVSVQDPKEDTTQQPPADTAGETPSQKTVFQ